MISAIQATALEMMRRRGQDATDQTKRLGWEAYVKGVVQDTMDMGLSRPISPLVRATRAAYVRNLNNAR